MAALPTLVSAGAVVANGAPAFGQATTAGNFLVAIVAAAGNTPSVCSDGTWSEATGAAAFSTGSAKTQIFYKANCAAGETAPTFTLAGGGAQLAEFTLSGASAFTFILDQTGNAVDQASGGNVTAGAVDKNPAGNDLIITADFWRVTTAGTDTTVDTYNNGATKTNLGNNDAASVTGHYRFAYGVTTGNAAADKNTVTFTRAMNASAYSLASFRPVVLLSPTGIASAFASGSQAVTRLLAATGVASTEAFGASVVLRILAAVGISSAQAFGVASLVRTLSPPGIAPGAFGTPAAVRLLAPGGIGSGQAFGIPTVVGNFLTPIETDVLVSDLTLASVLIGDRALARVMVADALADSVVVKDG